MGDVGVFLAAAVSGFADVDAATLSVARMTPAQVPIPVGVGAILLASVANLALKGGIAIFNSKRALVWPVMLGIGNQSLAILAGFFIARMFAVSG